MFNEHVRPIAEDLVSKKVPADTDEEVKKQLIDDLCDRLNDLLIRGLANTLTEAEMDQFEKALDEESKETINQLLTLPKVQTMMREVVVGFVSSYSQPTA